MSEPEDALRRAYSARLTQLQGLADGLREETEALLSQTPHIDRISFRVKNTERFLKKVGSRSSEDSYDEPLREVEDQVAGRVLVLFRDDLDRVMETIAKEYTSVELRHKAPPVNAFGYESAHSIFLIPPQVRPTEWNDDTTTPTTFELQVRTLFQHAWAEPQHDLGYKNTGPLPEETQRELAWAAASAWGADQALQRIADRHNSG